KQGGGLACRCCARRCARRTDTERCQCPRTLPVREEFHMKVGVLTLLFGSKPLEETFGYLQSLGVEAVEFGAGAYVRSGHFPTDELLNDEGALRRLKNGLQQRNLTISALSCHGNPL